ncbi:hypothetical protein JCM8547_001699 [Rhodosporidiobolus lusitaniae]
MLEAPPKVVTSPSQTHSSSNDDALNETLLNVLKSAQQDQARKSLQKQQVLVDQADKLKREYKAGMQKVLTEREAAVQKRIKEYQNRDMRLTEEIAATEERLLELLQVNASSVQLSSAAIQADSEERKADNRATLSNLERLVEEEAKGIDAAVNGLWEPLQEAENAGGREAGGQ